LLLEISSDFPTNDLEKAQKKIVGIRMWDILHQIVLSNYMRALVSCSVTQSVTDHRENEKEINDQENQEQDRHGKSNDPTDLSGF
jgi:hypothetical protein